MKKAASGAKERKGGRLSLPADRCANARNWVIGAARRSLGSEVSSRWLPPDVVEEWKWRGVPVWEHAGIICTGETYKTVVKLTFAKGAALADPSRLFKLKLSKAMLGAPSISTKARR